MFLISYESDWYKIVGYSLLVVMSTNLINLSLNRYTPFPKVTPLRSTLIGLISVAAIVVYVPSWWVIPILSLWGIGLYHVGNIFLKNAELENPLNMISLFGVVGLGSLLSVGTMHSHYGVFFGGGVHQVVYQLTGGIVALSYSIVSTTIILKIAKYLKWVR